MTTQTCIALHDDSQQMSEYEAPYQTKDEREAAKENYLQHPRSRSHAWFGKKIVLYISAFACESLLIFPMP